MLRLDKTPEQGIEAAMEVYKIILQKEAALACDSDHQVGKAEYSLYLMKFANNKEIKAKLKFLERIIAQSIEFD